MISIIIPTYNQRAFLEECVQSASATLGPEKEVIVVDDGSSDGTSEWLSGLKHIRHMTQKNGGSASARNLGLSVSTGKYVLSLDHDDLLAPHCLEEVRRALELFPESGAVWMNFSVFGHEPADDFLKQSPISHDPYNFATALDRAPGLEKEGCKLIAPEAAARLLCGAGLLSNSAMVYRRDVLAGWDARVCLGDDWGALFRTLSKGPFPLTVIRRVCWHKRVAGHNTSKQRGVEMRHRQCREMETVLAEYAPKLPAYAMSRVRSQLAENYLGTGWASSARGELGDSLKWYARALRVKPHWKPVWWGLRAVLRRLTGAPPQPTANSDEPRPT